MILFFYCLYFSEASQGPRICRLHRSSPRHQTLIKATIASLQRAVIEMEMITGDSRDTAEAVAMSLGIASLYFYRTKNTDLSICFMADLVPIKSHTSNIREGPS